MGYVEGRNLFIEYRVTEENTRLPLLAIELVERKVVAIFAAYLTAARAAKAATATIPIVFAGAGDPVMASCPATG
jgi:putative tryptophan/tyrosine transport system substrate-binding protein